MKLNNLSLTGKTYNNFINLSGKQKINQNNNIFEITQIKIYILNNLIFPLISNQWEILEENIIFIENIKNKLDYYYKIYHLEDIIIYKDIIKAIEIFLNEHHQLHDLEKKIYGSKEDNAVLTTMIYKTAMIKLKPEYEIYNLIFGKPEKNKNQIYDENIINDISKLLLINDINFNTIKNYINNKYNI
jgi:hypothetical protein